MKAYCFSFFSILIFLSCQKKTEVIISEKYIQSLLNTKELSDNEKAVVLDLDFWAKRVKSNPNSNTNLQKYAAMLTAKFHLYGNITDLQKAESIITKINIESKNTESGLMRTLANMASLQHQFQVAKALTINALKIGDNKYDTMLQLFDADFELGKITEAKIILSKIAKKYEYAYFFRLAKMQHFEGDLDKAIGSMKTASELSFGNKYLQQTALSNLADLQLHAGNFEEASQNYQKSIAIDQADFHSLKGLGLIAQNHDLNNKLAEQIFEFIAKKTDSPDIYFNLSQLAQSTGNKANEQKYAKLFSEQASQKMYGNMYNKYLVELYDGVLYNPARMLEIAEKEIKIRSTAQTNSWYAWALFQNNRKTEALAVYKNSVSGRPLEGLELYYVGKLLAANNRNYTSEKYFEAAFKNRFELSPNKKTEVEKRINS